MDIYQHFRKDEQPFIDQVLSWREQVERQYILKYSDFLDPREQYIYQSIIGQDEEINLHFFGGIEGTERKQALLAPYYETVSNESFPIDILTASYPVKFVNIEHRDVLGAFLSLGIMRKKLGDLAIDSNNGRIQIITSADISEYVATHLTSIKKASIQFKKIPISQAILIKDDWKTFETTVSSLRLDVILKHFYHLSRTQATELIKKDLVKVNFKIVEDPSFLVELGDIISCRGKGRSRLNQIIGQTKKQKWRINYARLSH
ncbi:RNA-binding protein [Amphibacillus sp. MSJ-3]|uniref:YlmH family RNA-binding protein n=1 Tax=Amphibacillus sp. MSJ-3 TaxID=2841505 RepID=UPI001C0F1B5E|nr:YlmH/Sll1252 family protein [Amphibacillus sp. MSJ-3]MBU5594630.1 RNA-binding protein [Amphibacillus sp. MSJ-3]